MALVIKTTGWEDYFDPAGGSWIKELILGAPDVGKTRSASFWPKPIFADCEDGRMSLADRKVPYGRIRSTADMDALINQLQFDAKKPPESRKYLTLVVDTIDHFQKIAISEKLKKEGKESLSGWADWGWLDGYMQQFIEKLLNLEMNLVVNCHFKNVAVGGDDDEKAKQVLQELRLKGDVKQWLLEEFDLIGLMETYYVAEAGQRVRKRRVRWHNEPSFPLLKDRSGSLPQFTDVDFSENDYQRLFDAIMSRTDSLPESQTVEEIEVEEEAEPETPDHEGGPVEVGTLPKKSSPAPKRGVAKKVGKKAAASVEPGEAIVKEKKVSDATPAPTEDVAKTEPDAEAATPVADTTPPVVDDAARMEAATELVKTELGGTPVEEKTGPKPEKYCGKQPASHQKFPAAPGCGKDLATEIPAKVNLALLRAKTMLCPACFDAWKTEQSA